MTDCVRRWAWTSALSREGLFVANNVLFVGFAIVVLLGTVFPLLYQAVNGGQVTVGTPYFATVAAPVGVVAAGADGPRAAGELAQRGPRASCGAGSA